jgi:DNA modification methylase
VVASKAQMGRVGSFRARREAGRCYEATISREDFLAWTLDVWRFPPASARRIGHPAPFPVELPRRLIELHTYAGEVVLDPFCGSGSTGVAAARCGRGFIGYDTDAGYLDLARSRLAAECRHLPAVGEQLTMLAGIARKVSW